MLLFSLEFPIKKPHMLSLCDVFFFSRIHFETPYEVEIWRPLKRDAWVLSSQALKCGKESLWCCSILGIVPIPSCWPNFGPSCWLSVGWQLTNKIYDPSAFNKLTDRWQAMFAFVCFLLGICRNEGTTPQINALIGWMRKNNHAVCEAYFLVQFFDEVCQTMLKIFSFLRLWHQCKPAAVNLSFSTFVWKPFMPSKRKCT